MVETLTYEQQKKLARFIADESIVVYCSVSIYDKVWRMNNDKPEQAVSNLPETPKDIEKFKEVMKRYQIDDSGPLAMYDMSEPTFD